MARGQLKELLQALDEARTQPYHFFTAIVISGMGFFADAYDFFSISLVVDLLWSRYYHQPEPGSTTIPRGVSAAINGIALCGAVPGQLVFGWLGDKMGRKRIYGVTLLLMVASSLASGFSFGKTGRSNVVAVLCFFRFWLGVSIGGDYPLSATIMSECANKRTRGAFMAAVFAMQGFGNLAAGIVGMVVSAAFLNSSPSNTDYVWRIVLMFGAVPAALTYYWRMKMPETARYTALVTMDAKKAAFDMSSILDMNIVPEPEEEDEAVVVVNELARQEQDHRQYGLFSTEFLHRHGIHLLGTSMSWLILDITFYSLNLFMKDIFCSIGLLPAMDHKDDDDPFKQTIKISAVHTAIALCGNLPGYFFTVAFVDVVGRVRIQLLGFAMMSVLILCLAAPFDYWTDPKHKYGFAVMYGIIFFFANFGPNTTTFIIPAEIFPARLRSTCHGISGAAGKVGAIIGVLVGSLCKEKHVRSMLFVLVVCNLVGLVFTLLLPESKGKSLEEITGEMVEQETQR